MDTIQAKEYWWDQNGNFHIIRSDTGAEEIYTDARIVDQKVTIDGKGVVREPLNFKGRVVGHYHGGGE